MITYSVFSDKGERIRNEDYTGFVELPGRFVFLLADGLGGHGNGDVASRFVVETMQRLLNENPQATIEDCIQETQEGLLAEQKKQNAENSMKTTISVLDIQGNRAQYFHVGDSRVYFFRNNKYNMRSQDHSVPQMLYMSGRIKEKEIRHHEDRSKLIKVMGTPWNAPKYDVSEEIDISNRDAFLLCSDGFWEFLEEKKMVKFLKKTKTAEEWLMMMQQEAQKNGKGNNMDNYSAIAVRVVEGK